MKLTKLLFIFILFIGCVEDDSYEYNESYCTVGNWRCHENKVQLCNSSERWETYQDCSAVHETCYFNRPDLQMGYTMMASCE